MAGNVLHLLFLLVTLTFAQYNDDSDYNDFEFYENLPTSYERNANANYRSAIPDDFYIVSDFEDAPESSNSVIEEPSRIFDNNLPDKKLTMASQRERDWFKRPEKIYRYTKHRIPGYDYDELDFMSGRVGFQRCDEKSIWANCVCQFTCQEPSVVDCFTPCRNGCECKEDYVFDEKTQSCVLPEQCSDTKDYLLYKK